MNVQLKLTRNLLVVLTLAAGMNGFDSSVHASSLSAQLTGPEENEAKTVYLFQEGVNLKSIVADIQKTDSGAVIDPIEEIATLTVKASSISQGVAVEKVVQSKYGTLIEETGKDPTVTSGDVQPDGMRFMPPNKPKAVIQSAASPSQELNSEEDSLYKKWLWDIDLVTQNGASYDIEGGNHDVKVGIVDSGLDFNHPDLKDNIVSTGRSFIDGVTDTQDYMGHGTMVAGSIAANGNIQGVAPGIGLVPYKVFHTGNADSSDVIEAIVTAARDDMDVINLSLGVYKSLKNKEEKAVHKAYERALKFAERENSFVVASAGTENIGFDLSNAKELAEARGYPGDAQLHMPGGLNRVYTVAATNKDNALTSYSNYGKNVSIGSPGGDFGPLADQGIYDVRYMTLTTYPTHLVQSPTSTYAGFEKGYEFMMGTSLAAPKVSATAALVIAEYEEVHGKKPKVREIKKLLDEGAMKADSKKKFGPGIISAYDSLQAIGK
ncbi:peptidase S8 [Jeotgalibacillus sp. S-D1]|uniref:S8 family serine peptidase n=1 Tax=Jeotgalibacillus sp. S-D1 TaxID=2552189 RepID=UPI00105A9B7F|nr:S8 family serine peptidase [Jeotgalibacillus sp. S-D1]TDL31980.1 peptidase S8 [Jeotgalibacillus sp. S-D1]